MFNHEESLYKSRSNEPIFKPTEQKDEWAEQTRQTYEKQRQMYEQSKMFEAQNATINAESTQSNKQIKIKSKHDFTFKYKPHIPDNNSDEDEDEMDKDTRDAKLLKDVKELLLRYDKLFSKGATDIDAKKVRDEITGMICKLSGKEIDELEFLPTDKLDAILRRNLKNIGKPDLEDRVNEDITNFRNSFESEENEYAFYKGTITELSAQKDLTAGEKLRLYEYSLCAVRYTTEMQDLQYNSLYNLRQDKLSSLSLELIDFKESKTGSFITMSEEDKEKHMDAAARLLASVSNEPEELFRHLPIEELSDRTSSTINLMLKNKEFIQKVRETVLRAKQFV